MSFSQLESRVNGSVLQHLANVTVLIGGVAVPGIFRNQSVVAAMGIGAEDTRPFVIVASSAVPARPADSTIEINGTPHVVATREPDGTGMTKLYLECTE